MTEDGEPPRNRPDHRYRICCRSRRPLAPPFVSERFQAAGGVDRRRAQQLRQLAGGVSVEPRIGAAGQPRDLAEAALDRRVAPLLEDEDLDAEEAELAGLRGKVVDRLLQRVADKNKDADLLLAGLAAGVGEDLADLGVAAAAIDAGHQVARARLVSLTHLLARHSPKPRK